MPAKVFISCAQASELERVVAREVGHWFKSKGFRAYVATQVHSIRDLNRGIITELKSADYYLFINFRRELLAGGSGDPLFRGSLYSNQELAIAYALGFDPMVFLNQRFAERGGMFGTIVSHAPDFDKADEVLPAVEEAVEAAGWSNTFSRHLTLEDVDWSETVPFNDGRPWEGIEKRKVEIQVLRGRIANGRPDVGATSVVARLKAITTADGTSLPLDDQTPLKVTNEPSFHHTIWPESKGRFDLLAIDAMNPAHVFLLSRNDCWPHRTILKAPGIYRLHYQVLAVEFPTLEFELELKLTGALKPKVRIIRR